MAVLEINWKPNRSQLRGFGWICLVAFGAIGGWIRWRGHVFGVDLQPSTAVTTAGVLWIVAVLCGLLAAAAPAALRPLYIGLIVLTYPIGFVVSYVVMAILFYGVMTPIGLIFRLIGRDALDRPFDAQARSYWVRRTPTTDVRRYFRQF